MLFSYYLALGVMMALVLLAMPWAIFGLSAELGQTRKENITLSAIFKQSSNINWLSAARFFLFGSRDLWFEVPLPYFLRDALFGVGLSRTAVGTYLAVFIIVYGQVQSWSPFLVLRPLKQGPPYTTNKFVGALWSGLLIFCPMYMAALMLGTEVFYPPGQDFATQVRETAVLSSDGTSPLLSSPFHFLCLFLLLFFFLFLFLPLFVFLFLLFSLPPLHFSSSPPSSSLLSLSFPLSPASAPSSPFTPHPPPPPPPHPLPLPFPPYTLERN